jgi:hypothetical protein
MTNSTYIKANMPDLQLPDEDGIGSTLALGNPAPVSRCSQVFNRSLKLLSKDIEGEDAVSLPGKAMENPGVCDGSLGFWGGSVLVDVAVVTDT